MRAIVNVHKESSHARFNKLTFEVKEVLSSLIALIIEGNTTDFTLKEVIIVDFAEEYQKAFDSDANLFRLLTAYKVANRIADTIHN